MLSSRTAALTILTVLVMGTAPRAMGAETITGQVIDLSCYMLDRKNTAPTHTGRGYACAQACAKEGFQVGLLTSSGQVFEIVGGLAANKNAKLIAHMGAMVSISGDVGKRDGFATIAADVLTTASTRAR